MRILIFKFLFLLKIKDLHFFRLTQRTLHQTIFRNTLFIRFRYTRQCWEDVTSYDASLRSTVRSKIVGNNDYVDYFLDPSKFQDDTYDNDQTGSIRK